MAIHLWLDQDQINEQDYGIMLYVFIAEPSAILAHCEPHSMAAGLVIGAGIFGIEGLDWIAAFYADWHFIDGSMLPVSSRNSRYVREHSFVVHNVASEEQSFKMEGRVWWFWWLVHGDVQIVSRCSMFLSSYNNKVPKANKICY